MKLITNSGEETLFKFDEDDLVYKKGNNLYARNRMRIILRCNEYLTGFF